MIPMVDKANIGWQLIPTWSNVPKEDANVARMLPESFVPGNWDVICHCGRESQEHIGNRRFNLCIKNHLKSYSESTSRPARSAIITNIVSTIRDAAYAGFVRTDTDTGRWYEVGDKMARDKVGQALRDAMNSETRGNKPQVQRKRKRPSLGNAKTANNSQQQASSADFSSQADKKHIAVDIHPIHNARLKSSETPILLIPTLKAAETRIQPNTQICSEPLVSMSMSSANRQGQLGSSDKDTPPHDCKSTESLKAISTKELSESKQSPGGAGSRSPKSSASDSNQLSLIEWFERDMQDAAL